MSNNEYLIEATVKRVVIDEIELKVEAESVDEAMNKATLVLDSYPDSHTESGISYCYTRRRDNLSTDLIQLSLKETK